MGAPTISVASCPGFRGHAEPMGGTDMRKLARGLWMVENEVGGWTVMFPEDY